MGAATCPRCGAPPWSKTAAFQAPDDVCCWAAGQRSENAYDSCARRMSAQLAAAERERRGIAEAWRTWAAYWLLRARQAWERQGWEDGPSEAETHEDIIAVLDWLDCDAGTDDPEHIKEAARLLALDVSHAPPGTTRFKIADLVARARRQGT